MGPYFMTLRNTVFEQQRFKGAAVRGAASGHSWHPSEKNTYINRKQLTLFTNCEQRFPLKVYDFAKTAI